MFAQFKNVVESFAQPNATNVRGSSGNLSLSPEAKQRTGSSERSTPARTSSLDSRPKLSLEDRLRATVTISGTNNTSTQDLATNVTQNHTPLDPTRIPLPLSPPSSPTNTDFIKTTFTDPLIGLSMKDGHHSLDDQPLIHPSASDEPIAMASIYPEHLSSSQNVAGPSSEVPQKDSTSSGDGEHDNVNLLRDKLKLIEMKFASESIRSYDYSH
jgi:hypothetical protein